MRTHTFTIAAPCQWLNANVRFHHMKETRLKAKWREVAGWLGTQARIAPFELATVDVHLWHAINRVRDAANYHPTVKPVIDGLVTDAKLLPNDDDAHMAGPFLFPGEPGNRPVTLPWEPRRFVGMTVTFTELLELPTGFPDGPGRINRAAFGRTAQDEGLVLDSGAGTDRAPSGDGPGTVGGA